MKIAVIGSGPLAIEAAAEFLHEGADVRLISQGDLGAKIKFLADHFPKLGILAADYIRPCTRERLQLDSSPQNFAQLWELYYRPLVEEITPHVFRRHVLRVQKRFLHVNEEIEDHTRLYDLFRVTYALNPSGMVEEQLRENPQLAEKLEGNILDSLKTQVESFEDFDLVFDCRGPFSNPLPLGAGENHALNEHTLSKESPFYYGFQVYKEIEEIKKKKNITIVGDGVLSALTFLSLREWLQSAGHILNIVTEKEHVFESFFKGDHFEGLKSEVKDTIATEMKSWRENCQNTEAELLKWRELPQHERVKVPRPQFPEPRLRLFEGYSISSCDKLIDQEEFYLTMEIPPWRNPEEEKKELVTLAQSCIIGQKGFGAIPLNFASQRMMAADEPGFFSTTKEGMKRPRDGFAALSSAREDIFRFFSRA